MGRLKKLALMVGIGLVVLCAIIASIPRGPDTPPRSGASGSAATSVPTSAPTSASATPTSSPLIVPTETSAPPAPVATQSPEDRYITIAQGSALPKLRQGMPSGEWKASIINVGAGPELQLTMPLNEALDNEQFVRLAKQSMAQMFNALFVADPTLQRVAIIGTYPRGGDAELPTVSIAIRREAFPEWGSVVRDEIDEAAEFVNVKEPYR